MDSETGGTDVPTLNEWVPAHDPITNTATRPNPINAVATVWPARERPARAACAERIIFGGGLSLGVVVIRIAHDWSVSDV